MVEQQSDNYAEKWGCFLQYHHKQIRKIQKLGFMNHIKEKMTFVIMGHYDCRTGILAIKKSSNAFPAKFLYSISMLEQYHSF